MAGTSSTLKYATVALALVIGLGVGLGAFTFVYAEGDSYLSNDPAACINCHVMREQYDGWTKSSHHAVATCNDCHLPDDFLGKWVTKASNGFWHSLAFTTGDFPDPMLIKPHNREIADQACLKCHSPIAESMFLRHPTPPVASCLGCHVSVGHPTFNTPSLLPARK